MHTIKNKSCFSGIGRHCKWCNWKKACVKREDLLAHDDNWLISRFEGNPPGTVRRAAVALERNTARSHALLVPHGDVHTGV